MQSTCGFNLFSPEYQPKSLSSVQPGHDGTAMNHAGGQHEYACIAGGENHDGCDERGNAVNPIVDEADNYGWMDYRSISGWKFPAWPLLKPSTRAKMTIGVRECSLDQRPTSSGHWLALSLEFLWDEGNYFKLDRLRVSPCRRNRMIRSRSCSHSSTREVQKSKVHSVCQITALVLF